MTNKTIVIPASNNNISNNKTKTRYIVTHEYKGDLSMQTAFKEVIEQQVMGNFEKWKDENSN